MTGWNEGARLRCAARQIVVQVVFGKDHDVDSVLKRNGGCPEGELLQGS